MDAVNREGFRIAHDISAYSFVAMAKACRTMLNPNSALLTLSYLGAERAIPNYNTMGLAKASLEANVRYMANAMGKETIRVNAVSAGLSVHWRHPGLKISAKCCRTAKQSLRCAVQSPQKMWVTRQRSSALIWPAVLPVKSCTLTAVSVSRQ